MALRATQIYLTEAQHAALEAAARRARKSKAQVLRDLIDGHLMPDAPPLFDFGNLVGSVRFGRPTDIARDKDEMISDAIWADFQRGRQA